MASEVLNALFSAKETISEALANASQATNNFDREIGELNLALAETEAVSEGTEEQFDALANASRGVRQSTSVLDRELNNIRNTFAEVDAAGELTEQQMNDLVSSFGAANVAAGTADEAVNDLALAFAELSAASEIADINVDRLRNSIISVGSSSMAAQSGIGTLNRAMLALYGTSELAQNGVGGLENDLNGVAGSATKASSQMSILSTIAGVTSFEFSSLSVNIGPFNVALRNILVQLPAILTGMGSMLAVVVSLTAAVATLGATLGALFAGGAIGVFQQYSEQFEESAEAAEAFMAALRDLFLEAMQPLMTEANMDLFISAINGAARVVNRFAQFFNQMRDDVLSFFDGVGGDMEAFFESLHDSFVIIEPVLQDLVNFFLNSFPRILVMFSEVTVKMQQNLGNLVDAFGQLFTELIHFAQVVLGAVAPVIAVVIQGLADFFTTLNKLNDEVLSSAIQFLALLAVFVRIETIIAGVFGWFGKLTAAMQAQAATGSFLANVYTAMRGELIALAAGKQTLSGAIASVRKQMAMNIAMTKQRIRQMITSNQLIMAQKERLLSLIPAWMANAAAAAKATIAAAPFSAVVLAAMAAVSAAVIIFQNWDSIMGAVSGSMESLKSLIMFIGQVIVSSFVGPVNLAIGILKAMAMPLMAIGDGVGRLIGTFISLINPVDSAGSSFGSLKGIVFEIVDAFGVVTTILGLVAKAIGSIMASGLSAYFDYLIWAMTTMASLLGSLIDGLMSIGIVSDSVSALSSSFSSFMDQLMNVDELIELVVEKLNSIPGVDIEGPEVSGAEVRSQIAAETDEQDKDDIQTDSDVNLNFEDNLEQQVDVQADPEDKEGLKRVVKDAMEEANAFDRRHQGHGG